MDKKQTTFNKTTNRTKMKDDINKELKRKIREVEQWVRNDLPRRVGKTAVINGMK